MKFNEYLSALFIAGNYATRPRLFAMARVIKSGYLVYFEFAIVPDHD